jgi:hypothetical protein
MLSLFPIIVLANVSAAFMMLAGCVVLVYVLIRKAHLEKQRENPRQRESRIVSEMPRLARTPKTWQTSDNDVEMTDMARDISGQLTTKMIVLEQLIADSQKQIERMEELLKRIEAAK